jgi:NAD(P)-dependent dehydrogenase (short-subunit alcohol dehydrogenase family)
MAGKLDGRIALVTAAGSGMGRAGAVLFAQEGATVVAVDVDPEAAAATVAAIEAGGGSGLALQCDVADEEQIRQVVARVEHEFGVLHVLYNHAGIPGEGGLDLTLEQWRRGIDVNMLGAFFFTSLCAPFLERAGGTGSIVFTASVSGVVGSTMSPLYSMAKGGVVVFAKSVALHLAPRGIRANVICPGPVDTPMLPLFFGRAPGSENVEAEIAGFMKTVVPLGRAGRAEEIAKAALFLACDDSSYITGVALPVDGGYCAR